MLEDDQGEAEKTIGEGEKWNTKDWITKSFYEDTSTTGEQSNNSNAADKLESSKGTCSDISKEGNESIAKSG